MGRVRGGPVEEDGGREEEYRRRGRTERWERNGKGEGYWEERWEEGEG